MKNNIIPAIRLTLVCLVFFCGIYTMAVWAVAQLAPGQGKGFTITENGKTYHINVGQSFTSDSYFWSRPSAVDYDAAGSGGSNFGPTNPDHLAEVEARIDTFLVHNPGISASQIPSDLVTASGSGLDPHISVQAAKVQINRIAAERNISELSLEELIDKNTEKPLLGLFGTERINVLKLNLDLESLK
ncbi:K(+)-transporting ATPase subunit C [Anditalea andensis]|uniref:Potassium-transporting ATPase KdpC subunit n=1 Tax=Anditalea andensis TaxID=1048983 RepID=A0A074L5W5_9BACT|nr:K(+)-transporting ATPase subunit C [Anditalea andensis]KEO75895.1 potassium-transporting ATPase subunit C [Anditalea andensis]